MRNPKELVRRMLGPAAAILAVVAGSGLYPTWAASWSAVNTGLPGAGLGVSSLAIDPKSPSTIYAQTLSLAPSPLFVPGLYKTTDGGASWTAVSSILGATTLAIDPKSSSTVYAGTNQGVLKSTNSGVSWIDAASGLPNGSVTKLVIDPLTPSTVYCVIYNVVPGVPFATIPSSLIFKSMNGGSSWSALDAGLPPGVFINSLVIDPAAPSTLYVLVPPTGPFSNGAPPKGALLKSTDGGESWNPLDLGLPAGPLSGFPTNLVIDRSSNLYALVPQFGGPAPAGGILKSTDRGNTWKALPPLPAGTAFGSLIVDPTDPSTIYVAGSIFTPSEEPTPPGPPKFVVLKSTDGGQHWNVYDVGLPPNTSLNSLALDPTDSSKIYAAFAGFPGFLISGLSSPVLAGGVFRSTDGGATWSNASAGLVSFDIRALAMSPTDSSTIFTGGAGGVFRSTNGGANWNPTALSDYTGSVVADSLNLYAQTGRPNGCNSDEGHLLRSADGGASWSDSVSPLNSGCILSATVSHAAPLAPSPADPKTLYLGESDDQDGYSAVLKSADGGANWSAAWDWFTGLRAGVRALAIDPMRPDTLFAGVDDGVATSPSNPAAPQSSGLFKSTDGGATWTNTGVSRGAVNLLAIDPANSNIVYAAADGHYSDPQGFQGLFKSANGGSTWQVIGKGLESIIGTRLTTATALRIDPANSNILYLGTSNNGVFRSADGGANWSPFNDGLANLQIRALIVARGTPHTVYTGTSGGVFKILDQ